MTEHLDALELRLSHERARRDAANVGDWAWRCAIVAQCEREVAAERAFLGLAVAEPSTMSDDDLLAALSGASA